jgi:hypothetical protein
MGYWYFWDASISLTPARLPRWALSKTAPRLYLRRARDDYSG